MLLEVGGFRLLTDPALDGLGGHYRATRLVPGYGSEKTAAPAIPADRIGPLDAVLLSHEHHFDNLDESGRKLLPGAGTVLTTRAGARKLGGNAIGLRPGQSRRLTAGGRTVEVTAMPARHGPPGPVGLVAGPVIGFLLRWEGERKPWWISGDTRWFGKLREALRREGPLGVALVHLGAARFPTTGGARYTMDAEEAAGAIGELDVETVVPIHYEGWTHFKQGREAVERGFSGAGIAARVHWLEPGEASGL